MKTKITLMVLGMILLIGIASAGTYDISAGDTISFDIGQVYDHYSITGNSTELNLNVSQEGTIVTIIINKYSLPDTFDITFFNKENEVIYKHHGGGGLRNIYSCGDWGNCINGIQERICTSGSLQTTETRNCLTTPIPTPPENETQPKQTTSFGSFLTGAVTGIGNFVKSGEGIAIGLGLITILIGSIILVNFRKNRLSKKK